MRVDKPEEIKKPEPFVPPQPMGKIIVLGLLTIACSNVFWYAWHHLLQQGLDFSAGAGSIIAIVSTLLAFCLMFTAMALVNVMVRWFAVALVIMAVSGFSLLIWFPVTLWSFLAAAMVIPAWMLWHRQMSVASANQLKFSPQQAASAGLSTAMTILLLAASLCYYSFLAGNSDSQAKFAESLINNGTTAVENVLEMYYHDKFSPTLSLDHFILNMEDAAAMKLVPSTGQPELDRAIAEGLDQAERAALDESRNQFLDTFKIQATGDEEMQSVVNKIVRRNIDTYLGKYMKFIPALLALSVFFLLKIFTFVYAELTKSMSYLAFTVLVWFRFLKVKKVQVEAEKVSL
ncbi:MAG: hypothetical protein WC544_01195 [Patescibacteria group bacterium]